MLTIFSTFVSFLMGGLPKILDFFQDKQDKSHELKLAQMQTDRELQLAAAGYIAQQHIEEIKLDEIRTQTNSDDRQMLLLMLGILQVNISLFFLFKMEFCRSYHHKLGRFLLLLAFVNHQVCCQSI